MTSRSRRSRPTTAWRRIPGRTAISLGLLAAVGVAAAQEPTPPAVVIPSVTAPAATQWSPFPPPPATAPAAVEGKTVTFQKPAGDTLPAAVPAEPAKPQEPAKPADPKDPPMERAAPAQALPGGIRILPTKEEVFRFDSDEVLNRRILTDLKKENERYPVPEPLVPAGTAYVPKTAAYPPSRTLLEPNYVVHRRLHFEEMNAERAGWEVGFLQPAISTAYFFKDALFWPQSLASGVHRGWYDTSAGKCLPGAPTPYYLYPPAFTVTGTLVEAAVVTGTVFILP